MPVDHDPSQREAQRPVGAAARRPYLTGLLGLVIGLVMGLVIGASSQAWWAQRDATPVRADVPVESAITAASAASLASALADATDWALQARTEASQGRFKESLPAFKQAEAQRPDDAQLFADHAEALGYVQASRSDAEHDGLLAKALTLDPRNVKALVLAGTAALQQQEFGLATEQLARAAQQAPAAQVELKKLIESRLAEARRGAEASAQAKPVPAKAP
ncbi:hypothetical protein BH11PSE10_BH11PSE10_06370 [soil metagenome]